MNREQAAQEYNNGQQDEQLDQPGAQNGAQVGIAALYLAVHVVALLQRVVALAQHAVELALRVVAVRLAAA